MPVKNSKIGKLINKGERHFKNKQFEDALSIFDLCLKIDRRNEKLWEYKAFALYELNRIDEAYECLEQIKDINPEKMRWLDEIRKIPEIQRCDKLMEDASMLIADQQFEKAIACYKEVIKSDPVCTDAYMNTGICYDYLGDYSSALDFFNMTLELYPLYPKAWLNKAITYQHMRDIDEALNCYEKATDLDKNYSLAYYNKGVLLMEMGNYRVALESFTKALETDPENENARYNAEICINALG
ncbi:MAG: tetratricopeptide repeat protein [Candidatus Methanoperedens sp.]|nr:tetratricopeptide repeat protein [Candidatus Methanoperedens sp.]